MSKFEVMVAALAGGIAQRMAVDADADTDNDTFEGTARLDDGDMDIVVTLSVTFEAKADAP